MNIVMINYEVYEKFNEIEIKKIFHIYLWMKLKKYK